MATRALILTAHQCKCGSGKLFVNCCEPLLLRTKFAQSPEELMRSRFVAYCDREAGYIYETHHPETRTNNLLDQLKDPKNQLQFVKLEVLHSDAQPLEGTVKFKAFFIADNRLQTHAETSLFKKVDKMWFYHSALSLSFEKDQSIKIGRNDLCFCGSGRKYKKCCSTAN